MTQEINLETVAASAAAELTKDLLKTTASTISESSRNAFQRLFPSFEKHLVSTYLKTKTVKILCRKDTPVDFEEIYVNSQFETGDIEVSDEEIIKKITQNKRIVISANGGAGKTFLMRYAWIKLFNTHKTRVPIFIELRKLNNLSSYNIEDFIRATAFGTDSFSQDSFKHFCKNGKFVFLLDGFDEVVKDKRAELESQIISMSQSFRDCGFVVSGRPDERFDGWQSFTTYRALPFDYERFKLLIERVPFDQSIKNSFLKLSTASFFETHNSFLSNPLLAIMMLMTYRDNAEIPTKLNTFYENCFSTLYSQHDALKESYSREKSLDRSTFKRTFSVFCLFTYIEDKFALDEYEFIEFIKKTKKYLDIDVATEDIAHDFLESVNLLIKDGTSYSFIHRSFQEYFSAYCVTSIITDRISDLLKLFAGRQHDATFRLAYEIHPSLVQERYLIPQYNDLVTNEILSPKDTNSVALPCLQAAGMKLTVSLYSFSSGVNLRHKRRFGITHVVWMPGFEEFFFAALGCFEAMNIGRDINNATFDILDKIVRKARESDMNLPGSVELDISVSYVNDKVIVELDSDDLSIHKEPAAEMLIESVQKTIDGELSDIENAISAGTQLIRSEMRLIQDASDSKRNTIEDFFQL